MYWRIFTRRGSTPIGWPRPRRVSTPITLGLVAGELIGQIDQAGKLDQMRRASGLTEQHADGARMLGLLQRHQAQQRRGRRTRVGAQDALRRECAQIVPKRLNRRHLKGTPEGGVGGDQFRSLGPIVLAAPLSLVGSALQFVR